MTTFIPSPHEVFYLIGRRDRDWALVEVVAVQDSTITVVDMAKGLSSRETITVDLTDTWWDLKPYIR